MKKNMVIVAAILTLLIFLVALPVTRAEIHWLWASLKEDAVSYESYLDTWPGGRHYATALVRFDNLSWQEAETKDTVTAYQDYIKKNADGTYLTEAKDRIDDFRWRDSVSADSIDEYLKYMQLHRDGKYYAEASIRVENLRWEEAVSANTVEAYERYLEIYKDGKYAREAVENIDLLHFQSAASDETIKAYQNYIDRYPNGNYIGNAEERIAELIIDNNVFETALQLDTEEALKAFLDEYPGHQKELDAKQALEDIMIRNKYEKALNVRTISSMSSFIKEYPNSKYVSDLLDEIWNYLMDEHPPDSYNCSTSLSSVKSSLPRAISGERSYIVAFAPREVEGEGDWTWSTIFYELAGQSSSIERMTPYITKPNGEISSWERPERNYINTVYLDPYGKGFYRWSCRGSFMNSSVVLDYLIVKSRTKLVGYSTN